MVNLFNNKTILIKIYLIIRQFINFIINPSQFLFPHGYVIISNVCFQVLISYYKALTTILIKIYAPSRWNWSLFAFYYAYIGAARGRGWQNICTVINLGSYQVVGIPCSVLFAFICNFGGMVSFSPEFCIFAISKELKFLWLRGFGWESYMALAYKWQHLLPWIYALIGMKV